VKTATAERPFCAFLIVSILCCPAALAEYGGGIGDHTQPFLISEPEHLLEMGAHPEHWYLHFKLTNDIDMSGYAWTADNVIGRGGTSFSGWFEGGGHVIRNLRFTADTANQVGLFGLIRRTDYRAIVEDLGLENVTIETQQANGVGTLAYGMGQMSRVENCWATYAITTGDNAQYVGGLVGYVGGGSIINSFSRGTLTVGANSENIGGLAGFCSSTLTGSSSSGTITVGNASRWIGGLTGYFAGSGQIDACSSACPISGGSMEKAGGLVGLHGDGQILNSFSTGTVRGTTDIGGLIGCSGLASSTSCYVRHCYSTGDVFVSGSSGGGLTGRTDGTTFEDSYSMGTVTGLDGSHQLGGLIGSVTSGTVTRCSAAGAVTTLTGSYASNIGGLIGVAGDSAVSQCYSSGPVTVMDGTGANCIGGLIGYQATGQVTSCYSVSPVSAATGTTQVGGLVGNLYLGTIYRSFAAGPVLNAGTSTGGLVGDTLATVTLTGCFWDKEATGQLTSAGGGKGMTTVLMQQQSTFTSASWDFADTWKMFTYPGLGWQAELGYSGDLSVSLAQGETGTFDISVFSLRNTTISWTLAGVDTCSWIAGASTVSGTSAGPSDATTVQFAVDSTGLDPGDYAHELTLAGDNGDIVKLPVVLRVFHRVKLDTFALLASHWAASGCDFGQPCKQADWYIDGVIDVKDLQQLAGAWLGEEVQTVRAEMEEGFESGDFSTLPWQHPGDAPWTITPGGYQGAYAAQSGLISDAQKSELEVTVDLTGWEVNRIEFAWRTSCEEGYDFLKFYIDGEEKGSWSGIQSAFSSPQSTCIPVTGGVRTLKWVYSKDASDFGGLDCAWIDSIRIYAE